MSKFYIHTNLDGSKGGKVHESIKLPPHAVVHEKIVLHPGVQVYPQTISNNVPLEFLGGQFFGGVYNGGIFHSGKFNGGRFDGGEFRLNPWNISRY